jgi:hypothetical protein
MKLRLLTSASALPILRQMGAQGGSSMIRSGDFSMLKVWVGLEARSFLQASIDTVRIMVRVLKTPLTSNRWNVVSSMTSSHQIYNLITADGLPLSVSRINLVSNCSHFEQPVTVGNLRCYSNVATSVMNTLRLTFCEIYLDRIAQ